MNDRNIEIWSTRLQREILALESSDDESKKIELLPPFISTLGHTLSIEGGIAKVEFRIDVEKSEKVSDAATAADEVGDGSEETQETENTDAAESKEEETKPAAEATKEVEQSSDNFVVLLLDASLYWRDNSAIDSNAPMCYPFQKPLAIIKSGASLFSKDSTISDGDEIMIDLDWTPSIHLSDAVTNVALKVSICCAFLRPTVVSLSLLYANAHAVQLLSVDSRMRQAWGASARCSKRGWVRRWGCVH